MKSQLLCTFTTRKDLDSTVESIKQPYDIVLNKISFQQVDSFIKPAKYNSVIKEGTPKFIKKFKGNILILNQGSISNKNYCHWLLDVLPKIKICLKFLMDTIKFVLIELSPNDL